jgi:hypothetical protein
MHVTEKEEQSTDDTPQSSSEPPMDVHDNTPSRTEQSADSGHGVHRSTPQIQDTSQDTIDRTTSEVVLLPTTNEVILLILTSRLHWRSTSYKN